MSLSWTTVDATEIARTWQVNKMNNRWELVSDVNKTFTANAPITVDNTNRGIEHDFDMTQIPRA